MIWRIGLCYLLFLLAIALVAIDEDYAYYTWIAVESYFSLIFIVLAYKLYSIRSELRSKLLDETKSLFLYAIVVAIEVIYSNAVYIMSYQRYEDTYLIIYYVYGDMFLVSAMWFLTGGKAIYYIINHSVKRKSVKKDVLSPPPKTVMVQQNGDVEL